jgi:hypothetical protein
LYWIIFYEVKRIPVFLNAFHQMLLKIGQTGSHSHQFTQYFGAIKSPVVKLSNSEFLVAGLFGSNLLRFHFGVYFSGTIFFTYQM